MPLLAYTTPSAAMSGVQCFLFVDVERGALVGEELDHRHRAAAVHRAVQRGLAVLVDVVDVAAADFERQLDRRERFLVRARDSRRAQMPTPAAAISAVVPSVGGERRVGAELEEHAHQRHVGRFRRHQERRARRCDSACCDCRRAALWSCAR